MENAFDTMRQALAEARAANQAADRYATQMADALKGRLRHVSPYALVELKRELRGFNIKTKTWAKGGA